MNRIKCIVFLLLFVFMIIVFQNICYGYNLELLLNADKTDVKVGDEVNVTLALSKGMQAADFTINYDSELLDFKSASIGNNFYNANTPGKIICSWFDTKDTKEFKFTFCAKKEGVANFSTKTENFYDGELIAATSYSEAILKVKLLSDGLSASNSANINNISTIGTVSNNSSIKEYKTDNTTSANNILPQTGDNFVIFVFLGLALFVFAIIIKSKLNFMKDI